MSHEPRYATRNLEFVNHLFGRLPFATLPKMQTTDSDLLFQTNQQIDATANRQRKALASEDVGSPIRVSSKILDVQVIWPDAWTAESGWLARHLNLEVRDHQSG